MNLWVIGSLTDSGRAADVFVGGWFMVWISSRGPFGGHDLDFQQIQGGQQIEFIEHEIEPGNHDFLFPKVYKPRIPICWPP